SDVVDYTPWLNSGTDTGAAAGFQGDFSYLNVDDDSPQAGSVGRIQEGVNLVSGSTVNVLPGVYAENVLVDKYVVITGAGSSDTADDTIVTSPATVDYKVGVFQIAASGLSSAEPIVLQNMRVQPNGQAGVSIGRFTEATGVTVDYLTLDNLWVIGTNNNAQTEQERGLYVDLTSTLNYLTVTDCAFNNLAYGWYIQKQVSADASTVSNVVVTNTVFNHNNLKGIYTEKLTDATFTDCTIDQNGFDATGLPSYFIPWMSGVDINLKAGTYQNIAFINATVTNNGLGGAKEGVGLTVKARTDGSYTTFPATLDNVLIANSTITGNERGIRIGEPGKNNPGPTNVVIHHNRIFGNVQTYSGTDGTAYGGLVNQCAADVTAENNWFGCNEGPNMAGCDATAAASTGLLDADPWLVVSADFDPLAMVVGGTGTLDADLIFNSAAADTSADGFVPDTTPAVFTATNGTFAPVAGTFTSGITGSTYTAAAVAGADNVCIDVDNEQICFALNALDPLAVTDLDLRQSDDAAAAKPWTLVPGSYATGFTMALDPAVEYYFLDSDTLTANRPVADGLYEFFVDTAPAGFFDYWAALGVVDGATGWQGVMWEIINGNQPMFYLKVVGTDYTLIDGMTYQMGGGETPLKINGTYLLGEYTFSGVVEDASGITDDVAVDVNFIEPLAVTDLDLRQSDDAAAAKPWTLVPGSYATGFTMALDPAVEYYFLDSDTLTANRPVADGLYEFFVDTAPAGFFDYWAALGVVDGATGWQGVMWEIINGNQPMFYLKVVGTDYTLIDGMTYQMGGGETPLKINGSYLPGAYSFTGAVADAFGFTADVTVDVLFNDIPTATAQTVTTAEDTALPITLTGVDLYPGALTYTVATQPTNGTLSGTAPALTYTPDADFNGTDSFTFTVSDGTETSAPATIDITVTAVNDAPVAVDDTASTDEDTAATILDSTLLDNDTDVDLDTLTLTEVSNPTNGAVVLAAGTITFTPTAGFSGTAGFDYTVSDGILTDTGHVTVTVGAVNDAPVAVDDTASTNEDTPLDILDSALLDNDTDPDGDTLTLTEVSNPTNGTVALAAGTITFTPAADFNGTAGFDYTVSDGTLTDTGHVTITVIAVNDAPVAVDDTASTNEDTAATILDSALLDNDTDPDGDTLTLTEVSNPTNGAVVLDAGTITFTPAADFNGTAGFDYTVSDGTLTDTGHVTITVIAVNDAPVAEDDAFTMAEDTVLNDTLTASDVDSTVLTFSGSGDTAHGAVVINTDGTFTYTPAADYFGEDSFEFTVSDGELSDTGTITITITDVPDNAAPVAVDDAYEMDEDTVLTINAPGVLNNDTDADEDPITAVLVAGPTNGTLTLNADGSFTYTPAPNFFGTDTFTYVANDGTSDSNITTVTLTVVDMPETKYIYLPIILK
ncbi:MAG TPA: Ig-like domain-containing protein, partial [Anaerolineaceae bacterium]|nr:Ig-like domain-containing protein [Anaerolineaceae bacterium]